MGSLEANLEIPAIDAEAINDAHRQARGHAENAVAHATRCGELLAAKKGELAHGEFKPWVEQHCEFAYSTAARYMKAAKQKSTGVDISSLQGLYSAPTPAKISSSHKPMARPDSADPLPDLSMTAQQKIDAYKRRLGNEFKARVEVEVRRRVREELEYVLPKYAREYEQLQRRNNAYKGVFTHQEYKTLLGWLHPDKHHGADEASRQKLESSFDLIRRHALELCGPDKPRTSSLPATVAELRRRRRAGRSNTPQT